MSNAATAARPAAHSARADDKPKILPPGNFMAAEFARARFDAIMPAGWAFEEALKPGFWGYVVSLLKRNPVTGEKDRTGAFIDLGTEDHAFYAKLYVRAVLERGLVVACIGPAVDADGHLCPVNLQTGLAWGGQVSISNDQFDVRWNIGKRGFDILRVADQQIVADASNFPTREAASDWIAKTTGKAVAS